MPQIILWFSLGFLVTAGLSQPSPGGGNPLPPSISVDADGIVMATPDLARLIIEVETQAATAVAAGQENAKQADAVLKAVKPALGPEDKLRTLGYRLTPVHSIRTSPLPRRSRGTKPLIRLRLRSWM